MRVADLDIRTPRGQLAAAVERHPTAPWDDEARAVALDVLTVRNVLLHHLLTGTKGIPTHSA